MGEWWRGGCGQGDKLVKMMENRGSSIFVIIILYGPPALPLKVKIIQCPNPPPPAMNTKLCCKKVIYSKNKKLLRKGIYCLVKTLILAHIEINVGNVSSKTNFTPFY